MVHAVSCPSEKRRPPTTCGWWLITMVAPASSATAVRLRTWSEGCRLYS